jgi:hypothetical protein
MSMKFDKNMKLAIDKINRNGVLLVFPVNNKKEPRSLWSEFHPRTPMRWEWNESGDNRVGKMWLLMKRLSNCGEVVYSKWYQGRATFFSKKLFTAMICLIRHHLAQAQGVDADSEISLDFTFGLNQTAKNLLETLEGDSPLSTRDLKKLCDLLGKDNESSYSRSMKALFSRLLIVAFGEVEDGAFPSLAVGATNLLFEELWQAAVHFAPAEAQGIVEEAMPLSSNFRKFFDKTLVRELASR